MKANQILWGLVVITLGTIFLLNNFDMIDLNFGFNWWKYWPVVLILVGGNIILKAYAKLDLSWITPVIFIIIMLSFVRPAGTVVTNDWLSWKKSPDIETLKKSAQSFDLDAAVSTATLNINCGAAKIMLLDTTKQLMNFEANGSQNYNVSKVSEKNTETINIKSEDTEEDFTSESSDRLTLKLNTKPTWEINLEAGAVNANMDLSAYKISNLNIDAGASSITAKLNNNLPLTNVNVEMGASAITISIPNNAACQIILDDALSSTSFEGIEQTSDNLYQSKDYNKATNKIAIKIESGVSKIKVERY